MKNVKLPSGANLKIHLAPFADSKALFQAILKEAKGFEINSKMETANVVKEIFCRGMSSPDVETCLWTCFKRCMYDEMKIDEQTFEAEKARQDYLSVCMEVARENVFPFVKSLYVEFERNLEMILKNPA